MPVPPRSDKPRPHHYQFAHRSLRWIAHQHGAEIVQAAATRDPTPLLVSLWNDVGTRVPEEQRLAPTGMEAVYRPDMVGVTLPPATNMGEGHFPGIGAARGRGR